ncbi:hypothetical protein Sp245p_27095 (plasmid) [Azospirillum baldaniorum]|nr:hypothetical protein Sp245p_27095 [Azospirillum baldaniorum]
MPVLLVAVTVPLAPRVAAVSVPVLLTVRFLPEPVRLASMVPTVVLRWCRRRWSRWRRSASPR